MQHIALGFVAYWRLERGAAASWGYVSPQKRLSKHQVQVQGFCAVRKNARAFSKVFSYNLQQLTCSGLQGIGNSSNWQSCSPSLASCVLAVQAYYLICMRPGVRML